MLIALITIISILILSEVKIDTITFILSTVLSNQIPDTEHVSYLSAMAGTAQEAQETPCCAGSLLPRCNAVPYIGPFGTQCACVELAFVISRWET